MRSQPESCICCSMLCPLPANTRLPGLFLCKTARRSLSRYFGESGIPPSPPAALIHPLHRRMLAEACCNPVHAHAKRNYHQWHPPWRVVPQHNLLQRPCSLTSTRAAVVRHVRTLTTHQAYRTTYSVVHRSITEPESSDPTEYDSSAWMPGSMTWCVLSSDETKQIIK